jgi:hypothetical protein
VFDVIELPAYEPKGPGVIYMGSMKDLERIAGCMALGHPIPQDLARRVGVLKLDENGKPE